MKKIECFQILHKDEVNDPGIEKYVMENLSYGLSKELKEKAKLRKEVLQSGKIKYILTVYVKDTKDEHDE